MSDKKDTLVLEIGVEELPAGFIPKAIADLKEITTHVLADARLGHGIVHIFGTPRRLSLVVEDLASCAQDKVDEISGPPSSADKKAVMGFAQAQGVAPEDLVAKVTPRGERMMALKRTPGLPAIKLLPELLPRLITSLNFPKTMMWNETKVRFARPIRWLLSLYGSRLIRFSLAGVKSGRYTYGLYILDPRPKQLRDAGKYVSVLNNHCVLLSPDERKKIIRKMSDSAAHSCGGKPEIREDLLDEVSNLVEYPTAVLGRFDPAFLTIPEPVLVTVMCKHQRVFPVRSNEGRLMPYFVGIRNGLSEHLSEVRDGYERVIRARLYDARFFYENDLKISLPERAKMLSRIEFQEKLGSVADKAARVKKLALVFAGKLRENNIEVNTDYAGRIAELAKADLGTEIVNELPELEGVAGRIYAGHFGEPEIVCAGIEQHYWPTAAAGNIPESNEACVVSLADKLDTLLGYFGVGIRPAGSGDPYGLRRATIGIIRIIIEKGWPLDFLEMCKNAWAGYLDSVRLDNLGFFQLLAFSQQRLENLWESEGYRIDEIRSVAGFPIQNREAEELDSRFRGNDDDERIKGGPWHNLSQAKARLVALSEARKNTGFEAIANAHKRAANILKQARNKNLLTGDLNIHEALLSQTEEKNLYAALVNVEVNFENYIRAADFEGTLKELLKIKEPIDGFFDKVMVMVEDPNVRNNRLAILNKAVTLFLKIADFSLLQ